MLTIADLDIAIKAVCPIDGVSGSPGGSMRIDYRPEATSEQRSAAEAVLASFDWNASPPWEMSAEEFSNLFSDDELAAIQTSTNPHVIRLRTILQTRRDPVRQDSTKLTDGIGLLVQLGILTQPRADRILSGQGPE